jgi:hypothetical protein
MISLGERMSAEINWKSNRPASILGGYDEIAR